MSECQEDESILVRLKWISVKDRLPTKEDSPILAWGDELEEYLNCAALHWINGWDGEGWYDHSDEYGMKQNEIEFWMPLPKPASRLQNVTDSGDDNEMDKY